MDESYGMCPDCMKPKTGFAWCNKCDPGRFLKEGKTSGNAEIDKLIYEVQLKTRHCYDNLEWITYDRFQDIQDIKPIGKGGFTDIFSATWLDGKVRLNRKTDMVVLKNIKDSNVFINEIKERIHSGSYITQFCGITKDPQAKEFIYDDNKRSCDKRVAYGKCNECKQPYTSDEGWCNCDTKRFLEESKTIGYHKKLGELSVDERMQFKEYGICIKCAQIKTSYVCNKCSYGECNECKQPYTTKEEWCNNCDTKRFFEENILDELSEDERRRFNEYGICTGCSQIKTSDFCNGCCFECKQPYTSDERWCNNCDTKIFFEESKTIGYHKKLDELSEDERVRFKEYGICLKCAQIKTSNDCNRCSYGECNECKQPYTSDERWCNNCDTKRFLEKSKTIGYHKKLDELSEGERKQFKNYGICSVCLQIMTSYSCNRCCFECKRPYTSEEKWCNNCDTKRFLEKSKIIGYHKKLDKLSEDERMRFKEYGICLRCAQINTSYACNRCSYGECNECKQAYTSYVRWCNNCDTKRFLEKSKIIGYRRKLDELSENERKQFKVYGICLECTQIKSSMWCTCDPMLSRDLIPIDSYFTTSLDPLLPVPDLENIWPE